MDRKAFRESENVEIREPGNILDTLDYLDTKARRAIISRLPESLRTKDMEGWLAPRMDPDQTGPSVFGDDRFSFPTPMETTQLKREAARPGDPAKPYPEITDELYPESVGSTNAPMAKIMQQLFSSPANVPLPPPRPKDAAPQAQGGLDQLFGEAMQAPAPDPEGDSEASSPEDLALVAKMGAKNMDLPATGAVRKDKLSTMNEAPAAKYDDSNPQRYANSGIATNPDSPIAEFFRQQAMLGFGNDPRAALLQQLQDGSGEVR
jgi:hypothetical protein